MPREEGFYWVCYYAGGPPEVWLWDGAEWLISGRADGVADGPGFEVVGERLAPPYVQPSMEADAPKQPV